MEPYGSQDPWVSNWIPKGLPSPGPWLFLDLHGPGPRRWRQRPLRALKGPHKALGKPIGNSGIPGSLGTQLETQGDILRHLLGTFKAFFLFFIRPSRPLRAL